MISKDSNYSIKEEILSEKNANNLLNQNINSEEYEFTLKTRNTTGNNKIYKI